MTDIKKCDCCGPKFEADKSCWGPTLEPCILKFPKNPHDWIRRPQDRKSDKFELFIMSYCPNCGRKGSVDSDRWFKIGKIIRNGSGETIEKVYNDSAKRELDPNTRTLPMFEVNHPFVSYVNDVQIGDRVQTIRGRGIVTALVNDFVVVDLDGDHGTYMFDKKGIWRIDL